MSEKEAEKMLPCVRFKLTKGQEEKLQPLYDLVNDAYLKDRRGMILMRLASPEEELKSIAVFVPFEYAAKIVKIMDAYYDAYYEKKGGD